MPPKKKARVSKAISKPSGNALDNAVEEPPMPMDVDSGSDKFVPDAWTDEQEISLFKSMIRWKPVGMHKHFRMIAISENLRNHGYTSARDDHTRIPGIWKKLNGLYNLEALDERENDMGNHDPGQAYFSFTLPQEDYGEDMFARRAAPEGSLSPPALQSGQPGGSESTTRRQSSVDDSDGLKSSPSSTNGQKRSVRGRIADTSGSQLKEQSVSVVVKGRAGRTKSTPAKDGSKGDAEDAEEAQGIITKAGSKGAVKASTTKVNRRKSGRKR